MLFVCVENAGRSLMAEAIFNARAPPGWVATSAGTEPAARPHPRTGALLREIGISLPRHAPRKLTLSMLGEAGRVITMGCLDRDSCPAYLGTRVDEDWELSDPNTLDDAGYRAVREEIGQRVGRLIARSRDGA